MLSHNITDWKDTEKILMNYSIPTCVLQYIEGYVRLG